MAVSRYKLALNNARFPLVSEWGSRAVLIPSMDVAGRANRGFQGSEENIDYDVPQIIYGENFVPVTNGVKSVSYLRIIDPTVNDDFDQIFPLRDETENTVLYSPGDGQNYVYDKLAGLWTTQPSTVLYGVYNYQLSGDTPESPATAQVTRAYVDGKTFVCYSRIGLRLNTDPPTPMTKDGSIFLWEPTTSTLVPIDAAGNTIIANLPLQPGQIGGVAGSNGYLLIWSGLTIYWAPFNGTSFDYDIYANGEVTGAGNQIPEDLQGPITTIIPVSGGYIIFTTKNAVAAFYNANNFGSPWIFKLIGDAGGIESYEQATVEGNLAAIYAYTTGGMQRISLNQAEDTFPDVTDFLGGRYIESFNTGDLTFESAASGSEFFTKVTYCGQRFLVISYGYMPGLFSYALVYDAGLKRWGKLRIVHRDCFFYSYGSQEEDITYNMLQDVSYDETDPTAYDDMIIASGNLVYPRQSVAFLLATGEVKLAVLDYRAKDDESEAFVLIGKNQLSRARLSTVHSVEIEGLREGGSVAILRSVNGATYDYQDTDTAGYLREQTANFAEYGFNEVTGKNFTLYINGDFFLTTAILEATNDGSF
jgi:hypothetical protein